MKTVVSGQWSAVNCQLDCAATNGVPHPRSRCTKSHRAPHPRDLLAFVARASVLILGLSCGIFAHGQGSVNDAAPKLKEFPLANFDEIGCRAKGRLQDKEYCQSKIMDQIVAEGKDAVPVLISQITDTRELNPPAFDLWNRMEVGDLAYYILYDLFLDSDWKTFNLPGLEQINPQCQNSAEACLHLLFKKRGRKFVQDRWLTAWNANKDRVYWDAQSRCFRLAENTKLK
jgi:hypothetical protein